MQPLNISQFIIKIIDDNKNVLKNKLKQLDSGEKLKVNKKKQKFVGKTTQIYYVLNYH